MRFLGGLSKRQKAAFTAAADRWVKAIVGDLPPVRIGDDVIDDILIEAQGRPIDGPGKILGQAGPTHVRPEGSGPAALTPAKGIMTFDTDDLKKINVPVLVMHGDDDQIVPYADSAPLSAKLLKNGTLKTYKGLPYGMITTRADVSNADLLAFIKA